MSGNPGYGAGRFALDVNGANAGYVKSVCVATPGLGQRALLAHELAHVAQQNKTGAYPSIVLKGGSLKVPDLARWQAMPTAQSVVLAVLDDKGRRTASYQVGRLKLGRVVKAAAPSKNEVAIESIELVHEGFDPR